MNRVEIPFNNKWKIDFNYDYLLVGGMPADSCSLGYSVLCSSSSGCGNQCSNTSSNSHDKNFYRNYNAFHNAFSNNHPNDVNLLVGLSHATYCSATGNTHNDSTMGLTYVGQNTTLCNQRYGNIVNVRIVQHELSHNFGVNDPSSASPCSSQLYYVWWI
jgi:hypothetical protein